MREKQTTLIKRTTFIVVMTIAVSALLLIHHERYGGATYSADVHPVERLFQNAEENPATAEKIPEPEDAYSVVQLTFGGNCTPASMLGSSFYGTFNALAEEEGAEYFFAGLRRIFQEDDCTTLGCAAVFSDESLSPVEKKAGETREWYLAPTKNADIFALSGVELLSVDNDRVGDYGAEGIASTKKALEDVGLSWTDSGKAKYFEKAGIRVGILGVALSDGADISGLLAWAEKASAECQYAVVYVERGEAEGDYYRNAARQLIDAGCNLVCYAGYTTGADPTCEVYNGGIYVDSLGYLLDGGNKFPTENTALYRLSITADEGEIVQVEGELISIEPYDEPWQPIVD